jgi:hypothetical protein
MISLSALRVNDRNEHAWWVWPFLCLHTVLGRRFCQAHQTCSAVWNNIKKQLVWLSKKANSRNCHQILIVWLELHLILEEYPLQRHHRGSFLSISSNFTPLCNTPASIWSLIPLALIGRRCSRGTTRQRTRIIHAQTHNLIGHGTLGNIHHHNHRHT